MISKPNRAVIIDCLKYWGPTVFWMSVIFIASADANSGLHSSWIVEPICRFLYPGINIEQLAKIHLIARKIAHMMEYSLLAILLLRALSHNRGEGRQWISTAWVLATAYAVTDEFHQSFVPGRGPSVRDVIIDSMGAAIGLLICYAVLSIKTGGRHAKEKRVSGQRPSLPKSPRQSFADRVLCTLHGEDSETQTQVSFSVKDRLQRANGGRVILGRSSATAHLCVRNTSVSGEHFSLNFHNGIIEVEDLNSSNGTRVNGRGLVPFAPVPVADGDKIEAGEILLHFRKFA